MKAKKIISMLLAGAMLISAAGCNRTEKSEGPVKLTWFVPKLLDSRGVDEVMTAVNEKLESKYNLQLELVGVESGNFDKKLQLMNAGMEEYDLAFTASWKNNYYTNVENGVCLDISELLPKYAPTLYKNINQTIWEGLMVDDKIYAVPQWQIMAKATAINISKESLDATGTDINSIKNWDDVETYLSKLHEVNPECNKVKTIWDQMQRYYGFLDVIGEGIPGAINYKESGKPVVVNQYESKEFEEFVYKMRSWEEKGYLVDKYIPDVEKYEKKEHRQMPYTVHIYSPGNEANMLKNLGYEWKMTQLSEAVLDAGSVLAALTYVSATSKHPEEAVKMLEIMNTDKEIFNLLVWGIEGKHYNKVGENKAEKIANSGYDGVSYWMLGDQRNSYMLPDQDDDLYDQIAEFNDSAVPSPILGFTADTSPISAEVNNCKAVLSEHRTMLELGLVDPKTALPEFINQLKIAGIDKVIAELQRQLDEWYEAKNS